MDDLFHKRLAEVIEQRRRTLADVGALFGISPQAVHDWVKGKTKPKPDRLKKLAEFLEVDKDWLAWGDPILNREKYFNKNVGKVPIFSLNDVDDGFTEVFKRYRQRDMVNQEDTGEYIFTNFSSPPSSLAIFIDDDSMDPEIRAGDIGIFDVLMREEPDDIVIVTLDPLSDLPKQTVIRRFEFEGENHCIFAPLNPRHRRLRFHVDDWGKEFEMGGVLTEMLRLTPAGRALKRRSRKL